MYGEDDGFTLGDSFACERCGAYALIGLKHGPPTQPGFPRRYPVDPDPPGLVIFTVDEVIDRRGRRDLVVRGRLGAGRIPPGMTLYTSVWNPVLIIGIEFVRRRTDTTLLVARTGICQVQPKMVLKSDHGGP